MKALKYAIVSAILALGIAAPVVSAQPSDSAPAKANQTQKQRQRPGGGGPRSDITAVLL